MDYLPPENYRDLTVKCVIGDSEVVKITTSRILLWRKSLYFRMLCANDNGVKEITIVGYSDIKIIKAFLSYIETGDYDNSYTSIPNFEYDLLSLFNFFQITFKKGGILSRFVSNIDTIAKYEMICDLDRNRREKGGFTYNIATTAALSLIKFLKNNKNLTIPKSLALDLIMKAGMNVKDCFAISEILDLFFSHNVELSIADVPSTCHNYNTIIYYLLAMKKRRDVPISDEDKLIYFDKIAYPSISSNSPPKS